MSDIIEKLGPRIRDPGVQHLIKETLVLAKEKAVSQDVIDSLVKGLELCALRTKFQEDTTSGESELCAKLFRDTMTHDWPKVYEEGKTTWNCKPTMISGRVESQFLKSYLTASNAKDVLEVGMFTGYSAFSVAESLPADGKVVTIDQDEYFKSFLLSRIEGSPHKDKIEFKTGNALEILQTLVEEKRSFDAVFLDAAKDEYEAYLKLCFEGNLLRSNGTILVDNAFQGKSGYTDPDSPSATFAKLISEDPQLHVVLVPIRDGIFVIRREEEVNGKAK